MNKIYRPGAIGALLDEYERAAADLKTLLLTFDQAGYAAIVDTQTTDPNCVSVQAIMNHVVRSGYGYANYIRKFVGAPWTRRKENYNLTTPETACGELDRVLAYTSDTLLTVSEHTFNDMKNIIEVAWGQRFDFDQLMEHAIVHILRHRRQIERFKIILSEK